MYTAWHVTGLCCCTKLCKLCSSTAIVVVDKNRGSRNSTATAADLEYIFKQKKYYINSATAATQPNDTRPTVLEWGSFTSRQLILITRPKPNPHRIRKGYSSLFSLSYTVLDNDSRRFLNNIFYLMRTYENRR